MRPALGSAEHRRRGSWRRDRHAVNGDEDAPGVDGRPPTEAERQQLLKGVPKTMQPFVDAVLGLASDWDAAALFTLRCYVLSCVRLTRLQEQARPNLSALHDELTANLELRRALLLE